MSEEQDYLKGIMVYKFDNTKESWQEFALKFRVIADSRPMRILLMALRAHLMIRKKLKYLKRMI